MAPNAPAPQCRANSFSWTYDGHATFNKRAKLESPQSKGKYKIVLENEKELGTGGEMFSYLYQSQLDRFMK